MPHTGCNGTRPTTNVALPARSWQQGPGVETARSCSTSHRLSTWQARHRTSCLLLAKSGPAERGRLKSHPDADSNAHGYPSVVRLPIASRHHRSLSDGQPKFVSSIGSLQTLPPPVLGQESPMLSHGILHPRRFQAVDRLASKGLGPRTTSGHMHQGVQGSAPRRGTTWRHPRNTSRRRVDGTDGVPHRRSRG